MGSLDVGKDFDALIVSLECNEVFDVSVSDTLEDKFQKFVNLGDDRNIKSVFVKGRKVK